MVQDPHDALASQFDQYEIHEELHRERPHVTYEVTVDGRRAVCKVASGEPTDVGAEAAVSDHLDRTTGVPAPAILATGADWFVATWADSLPAAGDAPDPADLSNTRAGALGAAMAFVHEETADQFTRPGFPRFSPDGESTTDPERGRYLTVDDRADWHTVAREFLQEHRSYLADVGWADPADRVLTLLDDRPALFEGAGAPVLCHGNIYPEHVGLSSPDVTDVDNIVAVIDFEHALVAPAEYDFWRTALPLFHARDGEPGPQFSAFREGYETVRSLPMGVERRREAWWLVNTVTYVTSLAVEHDGIGPEQRPRAAAMADWVDDVAASLEDQRT